MPTTFVSFYFILDEKRTGDRTKETSFELFKNFVNTGLRIIVYIDTRLEEQLKELVGSDNNITIIPFNFTESETYKLVEKVKDELGENFTQPAERNLFHDSERFMVLMNAKIEFVKKAMEYDKYASSNYAWLDFNICHVFKKTEETVERLKLIGCSDLKSNGIFLPGCWDQWQGLSDVLTKINWRFCGGFFIGDKDSLNKFYKENLREFESFIRTNKMVVWEVNFWHHLEVNSYVNFVWFKGDHNDTIVHVPSRFFKVVASLTTIPSRIETHCRKAVESIIHQVSHVYLSISRSYGRFKTGIKEVPEWTKKYDKLTVVFTEDKGPATKYLGALDKINNSWIFFMDDDQEYHPLIIRKMMDKVTENCVYQNRYNIIRGDTDGGLIHGFVGNLVHSSKLNNLRKFDLPECAKHTDDQWMSVYYHRNNIPIRPTGLEEYKDIFKVLNNGYEQIGPDSLASLNTRKDRVKKIAQHFGVKFLKNGDIVNESTMEVLKDEVCIYLFYYNDVELMEKQVTLLRKNLILNEGEVLRVFGTVDSNDEEMRTKMRNKWRELDVNIIEMPIPHLGGEGISEAFGQCFNHVFNNYIKNNTHVSAVFENDVMLVDRVNLEEYCRDYQVCGDVRFSALYLPARINHFWLGLLIFNHRKFRNSELFDGRCQHIQDIWTDCGAGTYYWLQKNKDDVRMIHTVGPHKDYSPFTSNTCIVHNVTDDVEYLPPNILKDGYNSTFRVVNYENKFLHLERMSQFHQYDKNEKKKWFNEAYVKLLVDKL